MNDFPKTIWGNGLNLSGLWARTPQRFEWDDELEGWWHRNGDVSILKLGFYFAPHGGLCTFASLDKNMVEVWTEGVWSSFLMLRVWTGVGLSK